MRTARCMGFSFGRTWGQRGPVDGIAAEPLYLDVSVPPNLRRSLPVDTRANAFAYVFAGAGTFRDASAPMGVRVEKEVAGAEVNIRDLTGNRTLVRFDSGDEISVQAGPEGIRFLLVAGRPIQEPVAWHGPIVMNTQAELMQAMRDLQNGTFINLACLGVHQICWCRFDGCRIRTKRDSNGQRA